MEDIAIYFIVFIFISTILYLFVSFNKTSNTEGIRRNKRNISEEAASIVRSYNINIYNNDEKISLSIQYPVYLYSYLSSHHQ